MLKKKNLFLFTVLLAFAAAFAVPAISVEPSPTPEASPTPTAPPLPAPPAQVQETEECNEWRFEPAGLEFEFCERGGRPGKAWTLQYGGTHEWQLTGLEADGTATIEYYWGDLFYCEDQVEVGGVLNCQDDFGWPPQWITIENLGVFTEPALSFESGPRYTMNAKISVTACDEDRLTPLYFDFYLCEGEEPVRVWAEFYGVDYEWRLLSLEENGYYEMNYYVDGEFICRNGGYVGGWFTCDNGSAEGIFFEALNLTFGPGVDAYGNRKPIMLADVNTFYSGGGSGAEAVSESIEEVVLEPGPNELSEAPAGTAKAVSARELGGQPAGSTQPSEPVASITPVIEPKQVDGILKAFVDWVASLFR